MSTTRMSLAALMAIFVNTALPMAANAADNTASSSANQQVIVPHVDRREVRVPKIASNDIEVGLFAGTYATQNFGSNPVYGVRLGYHVTEDFFLEAAYGQSKVNDENYRLILPGGIFPTGEQKLSYYNISMGYNVLPGEIFLGRNRAKPAALYLIGGVGNTNFMGQRKQTFNIGAGARVFLADWFGLQVDVRDHIFKYDLLGRRQSTQNIELTLGATFFF